MFKRNFKKDLKKLDNFYLFLLNFKNEILDELFLLKKNHTSDLNEGIQTNFFSQELEDLNLKYINKYRDIKAEYYGVIKEILLDEGIQ